MKKQYLFLFMILVISSCAIFMGCDDDNVPPPQIQSMAAEDINQVKDNLKQYKDFLPILEAFEASPDLLPEYKPALVIKSTFYSGASYLYVIVSDEGYSRIRCKDKYGGFRFYSTFDPGDIIGIPIDFENGDSLKLKNIQILKKYFQLEVAS